MPLDFDWNDIRILLALARTGSSLKAAQGLGISAPTIGRRLRALSLAIGQPLTIKTGGVLHLAPAAQRLIKAASRMEEAASDLTRVIQLEEETHHLRTPVCVTATTVVTLFLMKKLGHRVANGELSPVIFRSTSKTLSLSRGEAEIALRMGRLPRAEGLSCRRLGAISYGVYLQTGLADRAEELAFVGDAPMLATDHPMKSAQADWIDAQQHGETRVRITDLMLRYEACRAGLGMALLPCFLGDGDDALIRRRGENPDLTEPIYLLAHPDVLAQRNVRAIADSITEVITANRTVLQG